MSACFVGNHHVKSNNVCQAVSLARIFHPALAGLFLRILHHIRHFACSPPSTCTNTLSAGGLRKAPALALSSQAHDET